MLVFLWQHREKQPFLRRPWFKNWAKRVLTFPALVGALQRLGRLRAQGAAIGPGTVFSPVQISNANRLSVGENSFIGRVQMQAHAQIRIGSNVCINDGVRLITASHDVRDAGWKQFAKPIVIEDFAWIATGAVILPGVRVGRGAVVGAGSVVSKNVPDFAVAVGNPAIVRENVRPKELAYSPVRLLALANAWLGRPL